MSRTPRDGRRPSQSAHLMDMPRFAFADLPADKLVSTSFSVSVKDALNPQFDVCIDTSTLYGSLSQIGDVLGTHVNLLRNQQQKMDALTNRIATLEVARNREERESRPPAERPATAAGTERERERVESLSSLKALETRVEAVEKRLALAAEQQRAAARRELDTSALDKLKLEVAELTRSLASADSRLSAQAEDARTTAAELVGRTQTL